MICVGIWTTKNCVYLKHIFFLNFMIPKTYQIAPLCSSRYVICTSCFVFMFWIYGIWTIFKQCTAIAIGLPMKSHTNRIFVNPKPKFYVVKWSIKFLFISIFFFFLHRFGTFQARLIFLTQHLIQKCCLAIVELLFLL